jgi:sugar phosphate isomerase/epimerase
VVGTWAHIAAMRGEGCKMPIFIVDLELDGHDTEEEMIDACKEFIYDSLNFSASSVRILEISDKLKEEILKVNG